MVNFNKETYYCNVNVLPPAVGITIFLLNFLLFIVILTRNCVFQQLAVVPLSELQYLFRH